MVAVVLFVFALAPSVSGLSLYEPTPQTLVGFSRPPITQQFVLSAGEQILSVTMRVNGQPVPATFTPEGLVQYIPDRPLLPGEYEVDLSVQVQPGFVIRPVVTRFLFTVSPNAISEFPTITQEERSALAHVNLYRVRAGLPALGYNSTLAAAAVQHANYIVRNPESKSDAHHQTAGLPLFFGRGPGDRARYFTYPGGVAEVINFVDRAEDAVDGWMESLYHRLPLLYPGITEVGYGVSGVGSDQVNVMLVGPLNNTPGAILWPQPGQNQVPTSWNGAESPDPFDLYPDATKPVGYTISLTFGGQVDRLTLAQASLRDANGDVPVHRFSPGQDPRLTDSVALVPTAPLKPVTTYTVFMAGEVDLGTGIQPFEYRWSFTTAPEHPPLMNSRSVFSVSNVVSRMVIEGTGYTSGIRAFLGGLPVQSLTVLSDKLLQFEVPQGYTGGRSDLLLVTPGGREAAWDTFFTGLEPLSFGTQRAAYDIIGLTVDGIDSDLQGLVHRTTGTLMLPELVLEMAGAARSEIQAIDRSYFSLSGRWGEYTLGRTAASVAGQGLSLPLPIQVIAGVVYVPAEFIIRLTRGSMTRTPLQVSVVTIPEGIRDISEHWAKEQVLILLRTGIVAGYGDSSFRPNENLTRAAFVKMLVGARNIAPVLGDTGGFFDTAGHWSADQGFMGAAVMAGIIRPEEYVGGLFQPDRAITRAEIAIMITRAIGLDAQSALREVTVTSGTVIVDGRNYTDADAWMNPGYVVTAIEQGVVTGYLEETGFYTFRPTRLATRAEAVVMITRILDR